MPSKNQGFTLIEIMITVAIIAILTATAWPSFERYQEKNRRIDGIIALLQNSSRLEKCFTNNNGTYVGCTVTSPSPKGYYNITTPTLLAESFTVQATPTGIQASDAECANLTLNNLGEKTYSGSAAKMNRCWSQ